jgi:acetylornithine deacetylase/succinyl-diaminopimelate desuccinylase-like protein
VQRPEVQAALAKTIGVFMPAAMQGIDGVVTVNLGSKGVVELELVSSGEKWGRGPGKDIHSSLKAMVDSPAWHLVKALDTLVSDDGNTIAVDGYPKPPPLSESERRMIAVASQRRSEAQAKQQLGVQRWIDDLPWQQANERLESQPTINIEGLVGGYTGVGGKTVLPHRAVAKIDMRLVPGMTRDDAVAALKAHLAKRGFGDIEGQRIRRLRPHQHRRPTPAHPGPDRHASKGRHRSGAVAAQRGLISRLCVHRRAAEAGRRPFRPRPWQRRAWPGRVLPDRIHQPQAARHRRRDHVLRRIPVRTRELSPRRAG